MLTIQDVATADARGIAVAVTGAAKVEGDGIAVGSIVSGGVGSLLIAMGGDYYGEKFYVTGLLGRMEASRTCDIMRFVRPAIAAVTVSGEDMAILRNRHAGARRSG
jgi:hypothetical protein